MTELLGGTTSGIPAPIAGERSRGWNCYFPFPYARHCKITSDEGDFYYHVNYRTYSAGTEVETFRSGMLDELAEEIEAVAQALSKPKDATTVPPAAVRTSSTFAIAPGASYTVAQFEGPKCIFEFVVQLVERANERVAIFGHDLLPLTSMCAVHRWTPTEVSSRERS